MKVRNEEINIQKSSGIVESNFGISEGDQSHILMILRDKLYSNKILAVVREYTTNAIDAHVEAGKPDVPVEVSLPTALSSTFTVRDFGTGLTEEEVRTLYVMYGASTKRSSNSVIGQLGLGCKSGFAYSDKFHITSWKNGEKKLYCAYIDESKCGKIALMDTEPSDEPQGIEVQIQVRPEDFNGFYTAIKNLFPYMNPVPKVLGDIDLSVPEYSFQIELEDKTVCKIGSHCTSSVIMGSIPYKLDSYSLNLTNEMSCLLNYGINIYVPIGSVDIAASREALEYTETTKTFLLNVLETTCLRLASEVQKTITNATTLREAKIKFNSINFSLNRIIGKQEYFWNNEKITRDVLPVDSYEDTSFILYGLRYTSYRKRRRYDRKEKISASDDLILFDAVGIKGWQPKVSRYLNENPNYSSDKIFILTWTDEKKRKEIYDKNKLDEYNPIIVKDLKFKKIPRQPVQKKAPRSIAHIGEIFKLRDLKSQVNRNNYKRSNNWTKLDEVPKGKKYYIKIHSFNPIRETIGETHLPISVDSLDTALMLLKTKGKEIKYDEIIGIKHPEKIKMDNSWVSLKEEIITRINEVNIPKMVAEAREYDTIPSQTIQFINFIPKIARDTTAYRLLSAVLKLRDSKNLIGDTYSPSILLKNLGIEIPEIETEIPSLIDQAKKDYPIVSLGGLFPDLDGSIYSHTYRKAVNKDLTPVIEYINTQEKYRRKE